MTITFEEIRDNTKKATSRLRYKIVSNKYNELYFGDPYGKDFEAFKESIRHDGIYHPIIVVPLDLREETMMIIAGHRRFRAACEIGFELDWNRHFEVRWDLEGKEEEQIEFMIKDNLLRRQLSQEKKAELIFNVFQIRRNRKEREILQNYHDKKETDIRPALPLYPSPKKQNPANNEDLKNQELYSQIGNEYGYKPNTVRKYCNYGKYVTENPQLRGKPMSEVLSSNPSSFKNVWDNEEFTGAGFVMFPALILKFQNELGLKSNHVNFILHVLYYKRSQADPFPTVRTLAYNMGLSIRQVKNLIAEMVRNGYLEYYPDSQFKTQRFDFSPLAKFVVENTNVLLNHRIGRISRLHYPDPDPDETKKSKKGRKKK